MPNKIGSILIFLHLCIAVYATKYIHPDTGLNSKGMILKYGYPLEVHTIETEDGYLLETYRIPYGKNNIKSKSKYPVLLVPGLVCTSLIYLNLGPGLSLGFMLVDAGYDVWLANTRGTTWSKKHKSIDPVRNKKEFFDFSFHEIGIFDVTANIDYILKQTNLKKLFYVGHSQGTTSFFSMAATKPQYNEKIILMTAFAPVAYLLHVKNPLVSFFKHYFTEFQKLVEENRVYELLSLSPSLTPVVDMFCNDDAVTQEICVFPFYLLGGYSTNFNRSALPSILTEYPAGTSIKTLFHYTQLLITGKFQMYDYGVPENMKRYGTSAPPDYNISKITAAVALHYGELDSLSTPPDVEILMHQLPKVVKKQFIEGYSHADFLWSKNIVPVLNSGLIQMFKEYSKK